MAGSQNVPPLPRAVISITLAEGLVNPPAAASRPSVRSYAEKGIGAERVTDSSISGVALTDRWPNACLSYSGPSRRMRHLATPSPPCARLGIGSSLGHILDITHIRGFRLWLAVDVDTPYKCNA